MRAFRLGAIRAVRAASSRSAWGASLDEQHARAALAERLGVLLDDCLVLGQVERPDVGEDHRQVAGRDLLDDPPADLPVEAVERRGAVVEVTQRELDGDVVVK